MSKERLEEIKKNAVDYYDCITLNQEDFIWIIEQAERVQFLKEQRDALRRLYLIEKERVQELEEESYNAHLERLLDRKEQQNKRYREIIQDFIDHAEDYNIARVEEYSLRKALSE